MAAGQCVVDVAAGPGVTARLLAEQFGAEVVGVELGAAAVARARRGRPPAVRASWKATPRRCRSRTTFDVALWECSLCTFPDKPRAVAEMTRVVRPGGRIAIGDVTADAQALPVPLRTAAAAVACVADARTEAEYVALLESAGCDLIAQERRDGDLVAMIDRVEARLRVARMLAPPGEQRDRVREAVELVRLARAEAGRGRLRVRAAQRRRGSPAGLSSARPAREAIEADGAEVRGVRRMPATCRSAPHVRRRLRRATLRR